MPSYFPVYLDLQGRLCAVIGGGHEAERNVQRLLEAGAEVSLIAPTASAVLTDLAQRGLIRWMQREYQSGDLEDVWLAVCENDRPRVYQLVATEAVERKILLNVVDTTELCNYITPAIVHRGDITFAISTSGISPALARRLREELDGCPVLPSSPGRVEPCPVMRWAEAAGVLGEVRQELRSKGLRPEADRWQECMDDHFLDLYFNGRPQEAKSRLLRMLQEQPQASGKKV